MPNVLHYNIISRPYLSNGRAIGMIVIRPFICPSVRLLSVTDVLWLSFKS